MNDTYYLNLRLGLVLDISEYKNDWLKGSYRLDPSISLELSFEPIPRVAEIPGTAITYMGVWRSGPKSTVFEFQLGQVCHMPTNEDFDLYVGPIIQALTGYSPHN